MSFKLLVEQWLQGNEEALDKFQDYCFLSEGDLSYLIMVLQRIINIAPHDECPSQVLFMRGRLYHRGNKNDYPKAISLYNKAITLDNDWAVFNRALMHEKGQGGRVNLQAASFMYYQAFKLKKNNKFKEKLIELSLDPIKNGFESHLYLMLIYLQLGDTAEALKLYEANQKILADMLCRELILLNANLPETAELAQQIIDFLHQRNLPLETQSFWQYVQMKYLLYTGQDQEALTLYKELLYKEYLQKSVLLQADDFLSLGSAYLGSNLIDLSLDKLEQACDLFYRGFKQGDKDCKRLLTLLLRRKEILKYKEKPYISDLYNDQFKDVDEILYQRFELTQPEKEVKQKFLAKHNALLQQDKLGFFGRFRNTKIDSSTTFKEIIKHGIKANNRTRSVCIDLGWLSFEGNIISAEIRNFLNPDSYNQLLSNLKKVINKIAANAMEKSSNQKGKIIFLELTNKLQEMNDKVATPRDYLMLIASYVAKIKSTYQFREGALVYGLKELIKLFLLTTDVKDLVKTLDRLIKDYEPKYSEYETGTHSYRHLCKGHEEFYISYKFIKNVTQDFSATRNDRLTEKYLSLVSLDKRANCNTFSLL